MHSEVLYQAINKETKYYGLKLFGIATGVALGVALWLILNETAGVFACVGGYVFGSYISGLWHSSRLQRWLYWNLPIRFGARRVPLSHLRNFL